MKKVLFICVTMLLICISGKATERNLLLIPYPQQVSIKQGNYNLTDNVKIGADPLFTQELIFSYANIFICLFIISVYNSAIK